MHQTSSATMKEQAMTMPHFIVDIVQTIAERQSGAPGGAKWNVITAWFGWCLAGLMIIGFVFPGIGLIADWLGWHRSAEVAQAAAKYASVAAWPVMLILGSREWKRIKASLPPAAGK